MAVLSVLRRCYKSVRGAVATAIMFGIAPAYFILHAGWRVVSIVLPRRYYYTIDDYLWGSYQKVILFFFEHVTGADIRISGSIPTKAENVVFICNHQCTMDWIVTDIVASRQGMIGNLRYVFKDAIKYLPLYGYAFGVHGGVFVKRDGTYNEKNTKRVLQRLMDCNVDMQFVVFPEGTRFSTKRKELLAKSQAYAIENDVKPLTQVLTPRIKAFHCAVTTMKEYLDAVYDVTIVYETASSPRKAGVRSPAPNMWRFLVDDAPRILLHFERIPITDVPTSSQRATFRWLHHRFSHKDALLRRHFGIELPDESQPVVAGVVARDSVTNSLTDVFSDAQTSRLSLCTTFPPAFFYTASLVGFLGHPIGRKIYCGTLLGGSLLGMGYANLLL